MLNYLFSVYTDYRLCLIPSPSGHMTHHQGQRTEEERKPSSWTCFLAYYVSGEWWKRSVYHLLYLFTIAWWKLPTAVVHVSFFNIMCNLNITANKYIIYRLCDENKSKAMMKFNDEVTTNKLCFVFIIHALTWTNQPLFHSNI